MQIFQHFTYSPLQLSCTNIAERLYTLEKFLLISIHKYSATADDEFENRAEDKTIGADPEFFQRRGVFELFGSIKYMYTHRIFFYRRMLWEWGAQRPQKFW